MQPGMVRTDLWNQKKTDVKGKWAAFITGTAFAPLLLAASLPCTVNDAIENS